jgi:prepilin-type N-terminal cleavage/methylation domain-containing protein
MEDKMSLHNRNTYYNQRHAFTLMEMLMVIVIMGVILGSVVPSFRPFLEKTALKNTSQSLAYILRYARSLAIQRSMNVKLVLPSEPDAKIQLLVEADPIMASGTFIEEKLPVSIPKELGSTIRISKIEQNTLMGLQQTSEILFLPQGTTSDTLITLVDQSERVNMLGIVGLTGQVMVWEHAVETFYDE